GRAGLAGPQRSRHRDPDRDSAGRRGRRHELFRRRRSLLAERGGRVTIEPRYIQALAMGLDPAWRRLPEAQRCEDARSFTTAVEQAPGVQTYTYSMIGLQPGADLLIWRLGVSLDVLEEAAAAALRNGLGRWMRVKECLL